MKKETLDNIKKWYGIGNDKVLSVSQISSYIKNKLVNDTNLAQIYILGEITNISKPSSGHIYFDIKDKDSLLTCTLFRGSKANYSFNLENGLEVLVLGSVRIYEKKSSYQLNVELIFPVGEGAFFLKFKQLKKKLTNEGLFDEKHKKSIPSLPKSIGLITSKKSSAIKDVFKVLRSRSSNINVKLISTSMQGDNAPKEIINAINILNKFKDIETILIIRGGGSTEDLVCFNDESLARAIFNSKKPIISGIGHETDSTITDFVADKRASTPSVAARIAVVDKQELLENIHYYRNNLRKSYSYYLNVKKKDEKNKMYRAIIIAIVLFIIMYIIIKAIIGG